MVVMRFRDICKPQIIHIHEIIIQITPVPLTSHERLFLEDAGLRPFISNRLQKFASDIHDLFYKDTPTNLSKYRVEFYYPKSKQKAQYGHYTPGTLYVFAEDAEEAKQKVIEWLRGLLEPVEEDETRRFPRYNYLRDVKKKDMKLAARKVKGWEDFLDLLSHVANNKVELTPLDYFDDEDFMILLKQSRKKDFLDSITSLPKKEQRLLKRFYFHMIQSPYLSKENKDLLDQDIDFLMKKLPEDRGVRAAATDTRMAYTGVGPSYFWSVWEPEDFDIEQIMNDLDDVKEVKDTARKFGITTGDLLKIQEERFGHQEEHIELSRKLYRYLQKQIKISPHHKIFREGDYNDSRLRKYVQWDQLVEHLMRSQEEYAVAFPFRKEDSYQKASEWLWNFYKEGLPKFLPTLEKWKAALRILLDYRKRIRQERDNIPF